MNKRLLLLAYYFPPLGMSGVQRVLKWAKYLPDNGWDVTVLTAEPGAYFARDESLLQELDRPGVRVLRSRSLDPTRSVRAATVPIPSEGKRKLLSGISQSLLLPDNKIGWFPFAKAAAVDAFREQPFDMILSSAPPYTSHLLAKSLGRKFDIPYVLEYRDAWLENPRHVYPTGIHRRIVKIMEDGALAQCSGVVAINAQIANLIIDRLSLLCPDSAPGVDCIPHGFDAQDFESAAHSVSEREDPVFELLYSGVFYDTQKPDTFLRGLARFLATRPDVRTRIRASFLGLTPHYMSEMVASLGLEDIVSVDGYVAHQEAVTRLLQADALWMTVGNGPGAYMISTSKLFEYMGSRKPILGLVPRGTARETLASYQAAEIVDPDDVEGTARGIGLLFDRFDNGTLPIPDAAFVKSHERSVLAAHLASILENASARFELQRKHA